MSRIAPAILHFAPPPGSGHLGGRFYHSDAGRPNPTWMRPACRADELAIAAAADLEPTADALGRVTDVQDGSSYTHSLEGIVMAREPAT